MQYTFINWILFYIVFVPNSGPQNKVKYTETVHKNKKEKTYKNIVLRMSPRRPIFIGVEFISQINLCTQDAPFKPNLKRTEFKIK